MNTGRPFKIFVLEDNEWYNKLLVHNLSLNPDFEVRGFLNTKDFFAKAAHDFPDVVTLDYRLPDMEGFNVLQKIKDNYPETEVIVISAQENIQTAIELLKHGAYDYIVKTNDIKERLHTTINNIRKNVALKEKLSNLQQEVEKKYDFQKSIIGDSPAIKKVFTLIEKAITNNITVTIYGETGTGKEVVAKAIHYNSNRRSKAFVAVNVAAVPSELIESEMFGHEKGSFTGAVLRRVGKFEEADGGTLFLDEIGEMDLAFQAKLLRALQEKEITRIGSNKPVKTDCRIIVATNKNLQEEVKKGRFREDLYFRLFGLPIELPPLRERGKDILILAKHFMDSFCRENKISEKTLSNEAQKKILAYAFPGNVRELKSIIELATVMSNTEIINAEDIVLASNDMLTSVMDNDLTLRDYNHKILEAYLKKYDNNIGLVSKKLDISQATIYRMLKEKPVAHGKPSSF